MAISKLKSYSYKILIPCQYFIFTPFILNSTFGIVLPLQQILIRIYCLALVVGVALGNAGRGYVTSRALLALELPLVRRREYVVAFMFYCQPTLALLFRAQLYALCTLYAS